MTPDAAIGRIAVALAAAREADSSVRIPSKFLSADQALIRLVPSWVARAALVRSVRSSRTPQLMSYPTPPGVTTPPSVRVATTAPMGRP